MAASRRARAAPAHQPRELLQVELRLGVEVDAGEAAAGGGDEQGADRRVDDVEADVEQAFRRGGVAEAAVEIRRDAH